MTGQTKLSSPYPENEQFGALILLIFVSGIAGICLGLLGGFKFPQFWKFPGYTLKPVIKGIVIPPLIAMLIMGCIVRNYFGEIVIPYPQPWTGWIRGFCLCILLCRGGLQVTFKGQGLTMVFMSFVPQVCEATVVAFLAKNLFDMPLTMGYVLGYNLACISPSILVPGLMSLNDRGYAKKNNLSGTLIAAGTFDDIICIICFGICKTILLSQAGFTEESMAMSIGLLFIGNVVALLIGITLGLCGWFLKYIKNAQTRIYMKLCYCIFGAISFVVIEEYAESHDCKYIAGLFFGYTLSRVWGEEKPTKHIAWFWFFIQPCLFGTVGGSLLFSQIRASDLGNGVIIIIIGVTVRFIVVVIVTHSPKYFFKDRLFMGITWIGKATVQAALSALLLTEVKKYPKHEKYQEYYNYANIEQTVSIFSIVICATTGAILLNSLGTVLLHQDQTEQIDTKQCDKNQIPDNTNKGVVRIQVDNLNQDVSQSNITLTVRDTSTDLMTPHGLRIEDASETDLQINKQGGHQYFHKNKLHQISSSQLETNAYFAQQL